MAEAYATELQAALIGALLADAGVSGLVGDRVWDEPGQAAQRPYVSIGTIAPRPLRSDCGTAATVEFSIEAHSRPTAGGRIEATLIAERVVAALDGNLINVIGFSTVIMRWREQVVERENDGKSYAAVIAFTTILDA